MAFQLIVLAAALACVNAGGLAAVGYSPAASVSTAYLSQGPIGVASPLTYAAPSIGATQQSVVRSYGGNQAVSHYAKAVDSAFSSVRKYDTRITNDALTAYAHAAPVATYAHAAPIATYAHAAPVATYAQGAYAAPVATYAQGAYAAPVATYAQGAYAAPVATYAHAAPIATYAHAAPVATYAHAGPVVAKAALAYSPAVAVSHMSFSGLGTNYAW